MRQDVNYTQMCGLEGTAPASGLRPSLEDDVRISRAVRCGKPAVGKNVGRLESRKY